MKPDADSEIFDSFANDKLWVVRIIEVVNHSNVSDATLVRLLEAKVSKRDVVHHAAYKKLMERGIKIDEDKNLDVINYE
ncbi:hypothetical protein [Acinetobacter sp. YH12097]|uniref:hypothetical protein n=1 Tax=Acinetobacter sp. YH12097 TaxID=2601086 RepID=UPI001C554CA3|nr:hypothetical protein [Acinetobacter sp. YH12097]